MPEKRNTEKESRGSKTNRSWKLHLLSTLGPIQLIALAYMATPKTTIHTKD